MIDQTKKARLQRVQRAPSVEIQDENSQLWAVSYCDFLMVLLSFFILFFSARTPEKTESIISRIVRAQPADLVVLKEKVPQAVTQSSMDMPRLSEIRNSISDLNVSVVKSDDKLILVFPNNMYRKGELKLPQKFKNSLSKVLKSLSPHRSKLLLTFVGHSDSTRVVQLKKKGIKDNEQVSQVRAQEASSLSEAGGFSMEQVSIRGAGTLEQNSRTLTVEISLRGG